MLGLHGSYFRPLDGPDEQSQVGVGQVDCTITRQNGNEGNPQHTHSADDLYSNWMKSSRLTGTAKTDAEAERGIGSKQAPAGMLVVMELALTLSRLVCYEVRVHQWGGGREAVMGR